MNPSAGPQPVIGLLGAPGSGKSLVAQQLATLGCAVIDADRLAKQALDEPQVRDELERWWGPSVLDPAGRVNPKTVAAIVFNDADELRRLEALVHPRVDARRAELCQCYQLDPAVRAVVQDIPLLLEKRLDSGCDVLVYVDAPKAVRLERVERERGWSAADLERREKKQMPLDTKRDRADYVVDNSVAKSVCLDQVRRILSQILHERP